MSGIQTNSNLQGNRPIPWANFGRNDEERSLLDLFGKFETGKGSGIDLNEARNADGVDGVQGTPEHLYGPLRGELGLDVPGAPRDIAALTPEETQAAKALGDEIVGSLGNAFGKKGAPTGDLSLEMLKLRINDALNDPNTMNELIGAFDDIAEMFGQLGQEKMLKAEEAKKKAEKKAKKAKGWGVFGAIVAVVAAVALTVVTFGAGAALIALAVIAAAAVIGGLVAKSKGGEFTNGMMMGATIAAAAVTLVCGGALLLAALAPAAASMGGAAAAVTAAAASATAGGVGAGTAAASITSILSTLVVGGVGVGQAVSKHEATDAALDAQEFEKMAEFFHELAKRLSENKDDLVKFLQEVQESVASAFDDAMSQLDQKKSSQGALIAASAAT